MNKRKSFSLTAKAALAISAAVAAVCLISKKKKADPPQNISEQQYVVDSDSVEEVCELL